MPYITQELRDKLKTGYISPGPGVLNYQITMLIKHYWDRNQNYQGINDIVGALEGAKAEFYRRVAVPYEDSKREVNGDVY